MVFSSPFFISIFLPVLLITCFICGFRFRNAILLCFSLFFYAWGGPSALPIMLAVILFNFFFAKFISASKSPKIWLIIAISVNLFILIIFKYLDFIIANVNFFITWLGLPCIPQAEVALPIGISFYIFQAISYIVDVYRHNVAPQKNIFTFALYISLFPQLIAGPIVRYISIYHSFKTRQIIPENIQNGLIRFCVGLAKKVFIADNLGIMADYIFGSPVSQIPCFWAWIGAIAYALQIYYDFSAYSDMAIGIGKIFNFNFPENFNYPYSARTLQDFWRRWHISLTTWLRDYLYIPLGGSRGTIAKTRRNILIVLLCCGIWHGAAWNFLVWGIYNGLGLIGERIVFGKAIPDKSWNAINVTHTFLTLLFILSGWVIFRCESFSQTTEYLKIMFTGNTDYSILSLEIAWNYCVTFSNAIFLVMAIVFCFKIPGISFKAIENSSLKKIFILILFGLTYCCAMTTSYSPFLYFRF